MVVEKKSPEFEALLEHLKTSRGFDFTGYKRSSLMRRVQKRMSELPDIKTYGAYLDYLEVHPEEFTPLFNTILINVTSFFRDPTAWEALAKGVIPKIIRSKRAGEAIRVCSVGCASGEEAYSVAMLLADALGDKAYRDRVKIYATDVDGEALAQARRGSYPTKVVAQVPDKLRKKFLDGDTRGQHVVRTDLRRTVIFGRHDLVQDAPISRLDLLICRNTLMYFNSETQARILARFHFALNDTGFLFLGKSEMLLTHSDLFNTVNLKHRIFSKASKANLRDRLMVLAQAGDTEASNYLGRQVRLREVAFDTVPVAQLVIDANSRVMLISGQARTIFGLTANDVGRPLQDLELSYRPVELRSMIQQVHADHKPVVQTNVKWTGPDRTTKFFDVQVAHLQDNGDRPLGVSVSFFDVTRGQTLQETLQHSNEELETANEELQSTNEELETTNEELQSTNEELETTNEELQSTNEELETMNEELQSTNEELETTNDELQMRTEEVNRTNSFLHAVLSSLRGGVAVLDRRLNVLAWNAKAEDMWGARADEVRGMSIFALETGLPTEDLRATLRACLDGKSHEEEKLLDAVTRRGKKIKCKVICRPFETAPNEPGVVLFMEEVA